MKRKCVLGIDTSNYTTSVAVWFPDNGEMQSERLLLPVESGKRGLRQSDAVFHHTKQFSEVFSRFDFTEKEIEAIGVSVTPTGETGSYMPCFLVGKTLAHTLGSALNIPVFEFSHQAGHIAAGIFSSGRYEMLRERFLAFHVSGGTTDLVLCSPNYAKDLKSKSNSNLVNTDGREGIKEDGNILSITPLASTLDATAGQIIDRTGVKMGLKFPCGGQLDELAAQCSESFRPKVFIRDGSASFSGLENKCEGLIAEGDNSKAARFLFDYIYCAVRDMTRYQVDKTGIQKVLFVGGVMSNSIIRESLKCDFDCVFAKKEYSTDNAAGVAVLAGEKMRTKLYDK